MKAERQKKIDEQLGKEKITAAKLSLNAFCEDFGFLRRIYCRWQADWRRYVPGRGVAVLSRP